MKTNIVHGWLKGNGVQSFIDIAFQFDKKIIWNTPDH